MVLFTQLGFPDVAKGRTALGALITGAGEVINEKLFCNKGTWQRTGPRTGQSGHWVP